MSYVNILRGESSWATWDIVRGPVFPLLIYISNIVFAKSSIGLLMFSFLWYVLMLFVLFLSLKRILGFRSVEKKVLISAIVLFTIINPIIFGYYHALLTEYIAITLAVVGCYISFKYLKTDFFENRKRFVYYSFLLTFLIIFSWFLKQPYFSVIFFPFLIANILAIVDDRSIKNFIVRAASLISSMLLLFLSLILWNYFLSFKGINLETNRNVTNGLGSRLVLTTDSFKIVEDEEVYLESSVISNEHFSNSEKEMLLMGKEYKIVEIYDNNNRKLDMKIIETRNNLIPISSSIKFLVSEIFTRPALVLDSYFANYLAIINIYETYTPDGIGYYVKRGFDWNFENENATIARRIFYNSNNIFHMSDEGLERVLQFNQINNPPLLLNRAMQVISAPSNYLFKFNFLVLPFTILVSIACKTYIVIKKQKNDLINYVIILLGFSFLHILLHAITGALIDRYAVPAIISAMTGNILIIYILYTKILGRKRDEEAKEK